METVLLFLLTFSPIGEIPPAAIEAYDRAQIHFATRTEAGLRESLELFERSASMAPDFAKAHAGIADAACLLALYGYAPPADVLPKARDAAERAIELDQELAEAHAALGLTRYLYDWTWDEAEASFRRSIALDPDYASVRHWFAMLLMASGRYEESLQQIERAMALDPDSPLYQTKRGTILIAAERSNEAEAHLRSVAERFPSFAMAQRELGRIALARGDVEDALARFVEGTPDRAVALARLGRNAEARQVLDALEPSSVDAAVVRAALGDKELALAALERAFARRDPSLVYLKTLLGLESIRKEPRYQEIERRVVSRASR